MNIEVAIFFVIKKYNFYNKNKKVATQFFNCLLVLFETQIRRK